MQLVDQISVQINKLGLELLINKLGLEFLIKNRLLGPHEKSDRKAIQAAVSAALHQWSNGRGSRATVH